MSESKTEYAKRVRERSILRYFIGWIVRFLSSIRYKRAVRIARKNGAIIGEGVNMSVSLARKMNKNVVVGNHVNISTDDFSSFRYPIKIGNNVIIGKDVRFAMGSHNIDSPYWENCRPNAGLEIEDYVWLCPKCTILPSVKRIAYGAVVGAASVVVKDVERMSVVSGFPAKEIRKRECVHDGIFIETLSGNDFNLYRKFRKSNS